VIIADVLDDEGKRLADELGAPGRFCHLDVSEEDEWAAVLETAGPVTVLVNNAGILHFSALADTTLADYEAGHPGQPDRDVPRHAGGGRPG
jgi:3alpha(or 20beta)-hydroxysteroid dehydrogenase